MQDPLGRRVQVQISRQYSTFRVVGVVADSRLDPRRDNEAAQIYVPIEHERLKGTATLLVRPLAGQPIEAVRQLLRDLDPTLPLKVATLAERFEVRIAVTRALTGMIALLSAIALSLAAIGLHAAIMFSVVERTRELGIRVALGAPAAKVIGMVVGRSARVAAAGIAIGTGSAWALSRTLASNLYGIAQTDALTYLLGATALLGLGLLACIRPARYATQLDPLIAIRSE